MNLTLELGKYYLTRDKTLIGPITAHNGDYQYPFKGRVARLGNASSVTGYERVGVEVYYTPSGKFIANSNRPYEMDLIRDNAGVAPTYPQA